VVSVTETETVHGEFDAFDRWSMEARVEALITANDRALRAVRAAVPALTRAAEGVAARLLAGGRLVYAGAGTSGRLAVLDAAELPPTFDFDRSVVLMAGGAAAGETSVEGAEDDEDAAVAAVAAAKVDARDVVIGLAASGRTPYTVAAVRAARARGAFTVGIANNPGAPLLDVAEVGVLLDTGPEVIAGSTRLVAGTAQKIALNALSTAPMTELGAVYRNLMVAMRPKNEKLHQRAVAMVALATGRAETAARSALVRCDWRIREAIVHLETGLDPRRAERLLHEHGGRVREALEAHRRG
jgi:N-acetylmuramic acid 6-phosphate etherase